MYERYSVIMEMTNYQFMEDRITGKEEVIVLEAIIILKYLLENILKQLHCAILKMLIIL